MSFAVLELNDQSLLIQAADGALHSEPGFARLTSAGIETGETARASAWREPQHSYNQYWSQLNETPLPTREAWARHHADIAFAQLRGLWSQAGSPDSMAILVPGSFSDAQLALLLGMVGALPAQAVAVIDSALAACIGIEQDTLLLELQLHQAVLTVCRPQTLSVDIIDQEVFPDIGMLQIQNSVARHVSNLMIDSHRYDPLHESATEQAIFDQLPGWLLHLGWDEEISSTLPSQRGELPFILRRRDVKRLVGERLSGLDAFLARHRDCKRALSHAAGVLADLADEFAPAYVASQTAGTANCLSSQGLIGNQAEGMYRARSLVLQERPKEAGALAEEPATHLLHGDQAWPLNKPVSIRLTDNGVSLSNKVSGDAVLTVVLRNRALETIRHSAEVEARLPQSCKPGESIVVGGHALLLIEVRNG